MTPMQVAACFVKRGAEWGAYSRVVNLPARSKMNSQTQTPDSAIKNVSMIDLPSDVACGARQRQPLFGIKSQFRLRIS
jgi:hypothetical protein